MPRPRHSMSPLQPQLPPQPAPMSPSRKKQIPGTLVLNWQPSERQAAKPVMRRPMTACEACRAAKVKCNGQNTCERCKTRGLRCSYSPALNAQNEAGQGIGHSRKSTRDRSGTTRSPSNGQVMPPTSLSTSQNQTQSDPMSVDMTGNPFAMAETSPEMLPFPQTNNLPQPNQNELEHWGEETFNNALEEFDWVFPSCLDSTADTSQNGLDFLHSSTEAVSPSTNTERNTSSEQATTDSAESPSQPRPSYHCQCRVNMMAHIPGLEAAIQELPKPQLDKMFKVTGDVIRSCQESTYCGCYVGPVDLVCIMTVFEQTAVCFDYIAKSGFDGTVKVGIGSYSVSLTDDASLKRMLVLDLVNQANELLDSVSALAQNMFVAQSEPGAKRMGRSPACLNQLNLDYVREATASFKKLFRLITNFFGEKDPRK